VIKNDFSYDVEYDGNPQRVVHQIVLADTTGDGYYGTKPGLYLMGRKVCDIMHSLARLYETFNVKWHSVNVKFDRQGNLSIIVRTQSPKSEITKNVNFPQE